MLPKELIEYKKEILMELKGLGTVPAIGWINPLTLLMRRRESYLLGELRGVLVAIDILERSGRRG